MLDCKAGCASDEILKALDITWADLCEPRQETPGPSISYPYVDEAGELLFTVVRTADKKFWQKPANGRSGPGAMDGVRRVLYRLPEVVAAAQLHQTIYVAEGEKDVDALARAGVVATCNPGGAGKWRDEYTASLKGAGAVVVIADKDEPGRKHTQQVAASVRAVGITCSIVEARTGKDAADHLANGHGVDDFEPAEEQKAPDGEEALTMKDRIDAAYLSLGELRHRPPPAPLVEGVLDRNSLAFLFGRSGSRKTFVALDLALSVATGTWWHRHPVHKGNVLYIAGESIETLEERIDSWALARNIHGIDQLLAENFRFLDLAVNLGQPESVGYLLETLPKHLDPWPTLIAVDTLARSIVGLEENSNKEMGMVVGQLDRIRRMTGSCVLSIHHTGTAVTDRMRGASALYGAADTVLGCSSTEDVVSLTTESSKGGKQKNRADTWRLSLVARPYGGSVALDDYHGRKDNELSTMDLRVLEALHMVAVGEGATQSDWKTAAIAMGVSDGSFATARKRLLDAVLVVAPKGFGRGKPYRLSEAGKCRLIEQEEAA
ncbi:MAG: AAA family ATPase [Acidimicrobiia bacterium]